LTLQGEDQKLIGDLKMAAIIPLWVFIFQFNPLPRKGAKTYVSIDSHRRRRTLDYKISGGSSQ
jgi:hypothetical protein